MNERNWCAFDVEGRLGHEGITGVSIVSDQGKQYTTSPTGAIAILKGHAKEGYTLASHNAEYDISALFWPLGEPVRAVYFQRNFNRGEWAYARNRSRCQIWDSLHLSGDIALSDLGQAIGYPKYPTPQRLRGIDPNRYDWTCDKHGIGECVECYAVRDAEIVHRALSAYQDFCTSFGLSASRTLGSAAIALWHLFDTPEPCYLRSQPQREIARSAYVGGRVECFKLGTLGPLYTADIRSMYPSVMASTPMPDPKTTNYYEGEDIGAWVIDKEGVSDCTVFVPDMYCPPLPVVSDNRLHFPIGLVRGVWTHLELRSALARGCDLRRIHRTCFADTTIFPFSGFIEQLMLIRDAYIEAKDPRSAFIKSLAVKLYGRIGMGETLEYGSIDIMGTRTSSRDYPGAVLHRIGHQVYVEKGAVRKPSNAYCNPLWAAQITAAARVKLLGALELQGNALAYCDTDSVFSMQPIQGLSDGVGGLHETGTYDLGTIIGPKLYRLENHSGDSEYRAKGVPKRFAAAYIERGEAVFDSPVRPRAALRDKTEPGVWIKKTVHQAHAPAKRQPVNPGSVGSGTSWSDTRPLWFGSEPMNVEEGNGAPSKGISGFEGDVLDSTE